MTKTIFARIIDREIPAQIVYEDEMVLAFRDVNAQAPIHILIIPKQPLPQIAQMTVEDKPLLGHLMWVATEVARQLNISTGYRLVINNGDDGGQTVYHLHVHLLAGRFMSWPPG